jgi:PAS domain S-box-containing protein
MKQPINLLVKQPSLAEMLNDCSIDRLMAIDVDWNIIAWNKASENITGIQKQDIIGKNLLAAFPLLQDDEEMMQAIRFAFRGKAGFVPYNAQRFNRRYYENHFIPLQDQDEQVIGVMNIMHDVSYRIKAEKQLQQLNSRLEKKVKELEKMSNDLASFTYITSHDIKEPLKFVYTSLELLVKTEAKALSNGSKANLRRMQGSINRINLLLDDIVAISRISTSRFNPEPVDLNEILEQSIARLSKKISESRTVIESASLPVINGNPEMLSYLITNIIDNGIKFQPLHNTPHISINSSITNPGKHGMHAEKEYVRISFTDNGIGFEPQQSEQIFSMFEKLHDKKDYPGSGIGLTICKKVIEAHDGFITAESHPGQGAAFHCYFPANSVKA